jgi:outer membrane receptor protein involved in Fe transport
LSRNSIRETSIGAYVEASWSVTDKLRLLGGVRADYYDFSATARSPGSFAGGDTDSRVSPKVGLAFAATDWAELYGNWGRGFHSNDARGVVNSVDPLPGLAPGEGYEAGARFDVGAVKVTTAYWWLNLDSELIFVGDSNSVEPRGGSRRDGYEVTFFYRPVDWIGVDAVYTGSNARYSAASDGEYVEGSVEHAGQIGISAVKGNWEGSMRVRYLGPYALLPDNSQRAESETSVNLRGAYSFGRTTLYAELLNLFDADGKDIVYYYGAYVEGLDDAAIAALPDSEFNADFVDANLCGSGFNCRMSRAEEPRTLRVGIKMEF